MATARGEVDLSAVPLEDLADLELRVAATHGGEVLGSTVVKPSGRDRTATFKIEFEPVFNPGARLPCGIRFVVGPNIGDRELLSIDVGYKNYSFSSGTVEAPAKGRRRGEAAVADAPEAERDTSRMVADVGRIAIPAYLYRGWLVVCRTFTVRGRVVCRNWTYDPRTRRWAWCDDPVPGAKVEIYDVDRLLWWHTRSVITTVVTEVDGSFEAKFTWCCRRWRPWLWPRWEIDDVILEKIRDLFPIPLPPIPPEPDPFVIQSLVAGLTTSGQAAMPMAGGATAAEVAELTMSAESLRSVLPASPELAALRVWPWFDWSDCAPDVIFRVRQQCDGAEEIIYAEGVAQTRWNIPSAIDVTLVANDKACCLPTCDDPECPDCLKLTFVACIPHDQIGDAGAAGPPDVRGYVGAATMADRPLAGSLRLRGAIGTDIDYFKVQYSKDGGPFTDLLTPNFDGYSRRYWQGIPGWSPYITFAPVPKTYGGGTETVIMTRNHYEELNPAIPTFFSEVLWDDRDSLLDLATTAVPALGDGLYLLRFVGYEAVGAGDELVAGSDRVLRTCGLTTAETVHLRIDNQSSSHPLPHPCGFGTTHGCTEEPEAYIRNLVKNEGLPNEESVAVCDIVSMEEKDTLTVHFTVTVPPNVRDGHLAGYNMAAVFGASETFPIGTAAANAACPGPTDSSSARGTFVLDTAAPGVQLGPSYAAALSQGAPRPLWFGGDYKVTLRGCDFPECCAYDIGLRAWKRTTNGCSAPEWTHWNSYNNTFTVLRRTMCPDICRED